MGIHETKWKYLRGLAGVPRIFMGHTKRAVRYFRIKSIWMVTLVVACMKEEYRKSMAIVKRTLERTGCLVNLPKACLEPGQGSYISDTLGTVEWLVRVARRRLQSIRRLATNIRDADVVICGKVSSLVGETKQLKLVFH